MKSHMNVETVWPIWPIVYELFRNSMKSFSTVSFNQKNEETQNFALIEKQGIEQHELNGNGRERAREMRSGFNGTR